MGDTFRLAMQLTMIDLLSGVASRVKSNIQQLGAAGKQVGKDFEQFERNATRGLKAIAVAGYTINKIKPGVAAAADLQESLIDVRMSLMRSGKDAATLGLELKQVRDTAVDLQKITPFSAQDVVGVQKELLNSGLEFQDVVGKGAARAAMTLATITKNAPEAAAAAMLNVGIPYHLKSNEYGQVSDVIQRHVMSGRMKLPDMNAALPYLAPVAKSFKVPWQDMLTALAVLGEQGQIGSMAGTHLKDFYERLTGASRISRRVMTAVNQDLVGKGKAPLQFWDAAGELKPTYELIKNMRSSLGSYNTHQKMFILSKIFGEQAGLGALALMSEGTGSWEFIKAKVEEVAGAEEKMTERLKGFNASVTALGGTSKTTLATLFDPALDSLTMMVKLANDVVDSVGKTAGEHPKVTATFNAMLGVGAAAAGGYGIYKLAKAGFYGGKVLKGLRGLPGFSLASGVAEGKAVQAATGVNPVFVTNWPATFGAASAVTSAGSIVTGMGGRTALAAGLATGGLVGSIVAAPFISKYLSDSARENGWGSQTIRRGSKEYDVMGIGGAKRPINLSIQIDSQGRVLSSSDDLSSHINTVKRGAFFDGLLTSH